MKVQNSTITNKINDTFIFKSIYFVGLTLISFVSLFLISINTFAATANLASTTPQMVSYTITDGYGAYTGTGDSKLQASANAREACVAQKVLTYEARHGGVTPDEDTTDLFIDACINK